MHGGCCSDPYQFTLTGVGVFTLNSMLVVYNTSNVPIGSNLGGSVVIPVGFSGVCNMPANFSGSAFTMAYTNGFRAGGDFVVDDVTFNGASGAVPEPSTYALVGSSIAMICIGRRARTRS
jgi:hypothetical protein